MNTFPAIIPITKARGQLTKLTQSLPQQEYIILTKGGEPAAALVDYTYLERLRQEVSKYSKKTFIDPTLLPQTREFSDKEIAGWLEADTLQ